MDDKKTSVVLGVVHVKQKEYKVLIIKRPRRHSKGSLIANIFSVVFLFGTVGVWFMNSAEAGIASWAPPQVQLIARAGNNFTCAVADNKVYCWGSTNTYGQLGTNDNTTTSLIPRQVTDPNGVLVGKTITAIATANTGNVCVVASNVPYCWGRGQFGVLGDTTTSDRYYPAPVTTSGVLSGKTITAIAGGDGHMCVVASGAAYCWGTNGQGRVGDGTTTLRTTPVAVSTSGALSGKTVTGITGLSGSTCAVASGAAYCWGDDSSGYLGNDASFTGSTTPVAVDTSGVLSGKTVVSIASGQNHACALTADGLVDCWGQNTAGQLGNSSTTTSAVPVAVTTTGALSGKTVATLRSGDYRNCVIDTANKAYCWGLGPVGDGSAGAKSSPVAVTSASTLNGMNIIQVSANVNGNCFLNDQNRLYCNSSTAGSLGNNTSNTSNAPVPVLFTATFNAPNYRLYANANSATPGSPLAGINTAATLSSYGQAFRARMGIKTTAQIGGVSVGVDYSCGVSDGKAYCWGSGANGRLGNNSTSDSLVPVAVNTAGVLSGKTILSVVAGGGHTCAIASDKQAYCWGLNTYGELGNNSTSDSLVPVAVNTGGVLSGKTVLSISAGSAHTCVIASDNQAYCWGVNGNGQLGNNSTTESHVPVAVNTAGVLSGKTVLSIAPYGAHTCVIASDNQAYCWGFNGQGQLGNNSTTESHVPVAVNTAGVLSGKTVLTISAGDSHTCAIASNNQAYCWGYNTDGQLGNNSTTESHVPVAVNTAGVLSGKTVLTISAGWAQTCAIASDNQAYCWGDNASGQLGNNSTSDSLVPVAINTSGVLSGKTVLSVVTRNSHTCAVASNNQAYCWGDNTYGQFGNNSTTQSLVAVATTIDGYIPGADINPSDNTYKLQFAQKTLASCSIQTGFADVTGATAIAYNTNAGVSNGAAITTNANDPVPTSDSVAQTYISSSGTFTNTNTITSGKTGLWDFSLKDSSGSYGTSYCLRITYSDGTPIEGTVQYPEITTTTKKDVATAPYRFYQNANSAAPGSPLALTGQPAHLSYSGQAFRLRTGVMGTLSALKVATGSSHVCVIASDNNVYCWGMGLYGQLGDNSTAYNFTPTAVDTTGVLSGKTVTTISTGSNYTCVIASDSNSYCWGDNTNGQLGNNSTTQGLVPVAVDTTGVLSGKTISSISTGTSHTCVIASDNKAYCWGLNTNGQLGNNSTTQSLVPVAVDTTGALSGKTILSIKVGTSHTCVIASDNKAYCWGLNTNGQLGNNSTTQSLVPVAVDTTGALSGKTINSLSAGNFHNCVVASDNNAYCWGHGGNGRLGNNTGSQSNIPVAVTTTGALSGKTINSITAGASHSCAIASDNQAYCWGYNQNGYLGNNSTTQSLVPVAVDTTGVLSAKPLTSIASKFFDTCAIGSDSQVYCWGNNGSAQLGVGDVNTYLVPQRVTGYLPGIQVGVTGKTAWSVAAGSNHTCAIASDNKAYCWGFNSNGQLGNGDTATVSPAVSAVDTTGVLSGKTILSIENGLYHTCAIASDHLVYCWGMGNGGKLGNNSTVDSSVPVAVDTTGVLSGKTILSLAVGSGHSCIVASDNKAYCWGGNGNGQLGNNSVTDSSVPVAVDTTGVLSGKTILSVTVGLAHTCAIASDNQAYCWGLNGNWQLGNNSNTESHVPVAVSTSGVFAGKTIFSITAGYYHTCAIASDNQAYCWGTGSNGRLGNGSTSDAHVPSAVTTSGALSGKTILSLSAGHYHTCAVASDNQAYCWGQNTFGQLGNNSTTSSSVPVAVDTTGVLSGKTIIMTTGGDQYACALASDNQVYCWGQNTYGQLGDGSFNQSLVPVQGYTLQYAPIGGAVSASANNYTLQYAVKSAAVCSAQTTGFADITTSTPIAYNTNAGVSNGASISSNSTDPLPSTQTVAQTYISSTGSFTNSSAITYGAMGMWDFSLKDNSAPYNTTYCLRVAYSDGSALTVTQALPEVRTTLGVLSLGFVDTVGSTLSTPTMNFGSIAMKGSDSQVSTGTFGTASQKLRIYNDLATNGWTVNIAATNGSNALWNRTDNLAKYDFNDSSDDVDGGDSDLLGGRLTINPAAGSVVSPSGCSTSGTSKGTSASFDEGVVDSITLFSASSGAAMGCNYDLLGVGLSQSIPAAQSIGTYTLDVTATVVAL